MEVSALLTHRKAGLGTPRAQVAPVLGLPDPEVCLGIRSADLAQQQVITLAPDLLTRGVRREGSHSASSEARFAESWVEEQQGQTA